MDTSPRLAATFSRWGSRSPAGRLLANCAGAAGVATIMSTQFLAQPFVWRYFALDEIFVGWGLVLRDRLFVALGIALALTTAELGSGKEGRAPLAAIFVAIVSGAALSEVILQWLDPQGDRSGTLALAGRVIRWAVVAGAACALLSLWRRSDAIAAHGHAEQLRRLRADRLVTRLRIAALQRQIEPHFLFNTLATIKRLQRSNPADGRLLLSRFLYFLRGTFAARSTTEVKLREELDLADAYLGICSQRMGGTLRWSIEVHESLLDHGFPRFGLATLLENAVKHGIAPLPDGGEIRIAARVIDGDLEVSVADTGIGFAADHGSGLGLANIQEQLTLRYGKSARLTLAANRPRGVRAIIRIPQGSHPPSAPPR